MAFIVLSDIRNYPKNNSVIMSLKNRNFNSELKISYFLNSLFNFHQYLKEEAIKVFVLLTRWTIAR